MKTIRVAKDGTVTYDVPVPHEAANIQCHYVLGTQRDPDSGIEYDLVCKKRAGHATPKGMLQHTPKDYRIVATPPHTAHGERFKPTGIPAGVDQSITLPHDCANHLKDVGDVERGYR